MEEIAKTIKEQIEQATAIEIGAVDFLEIEYEAASGRSRTQFHEPDLIVLQEPYSDSRSSSVKIANVWVNIPTLVRFALALPAQYIAATTQTPVLAICATLSVVAGLYYGARVEINDEDAVVLMAANSLAATEAIGYEQLFQRTNEFRKQYSLKDIDADGFGRALISLGKLGCLEAVSQQTYKISERLMLKRR